ncbi:ABC transporter permease [Ferruginivarius sediminum]|uniref:ABC transporter permease n=1 Tax=Ferruginivarius sediminum TaxID=2661937 RepID=A0A369TC97_9PROT|nr:ABC transporter permease [Ferruginivarius sediminum]RDD62953.1 ABC transporter permease [Ferruginivarius sediminum]
MPSVLDRKLLRDIRAIRGQALAIALVIAAGVALFVMALGTLRALEGTLEAYYAEYRFADVFAPLVRAPDRLARDIAAIPGVAVVQTRVSGPATLTVPGRPAPIAGRVTSVPVSGQPDLNRLYLASGRWPSADNPDEVLVDQPFARAVGLRPGDGLTAIVDGKRRRLRIVGLALSPEYIYALAPGQLVPDAGSFGVVWMGRKAAAAAFDLEGAFNDVALRTARGARVESMIARLDDLLARYGGTGAYARKDHSSHAFIRNELDGLVATGSVAPPIFLAVAAFLLNMVVARTIDRERQQIGLLKAFGYTDIAVGWHYVKLVIALTLAGVALGEVVGAWLGKELAELYTEYFHFPILRYELTADVLVGAAAVSLLAGLLGTAFSVRRAVKLPPAVAMRPPEPPRYHRGLLDRLRINALADPATRMVLRNLVRRPLRAGLTTLGLATAVALLVGSLFMRESIQRLIDIELTLAQRQDLFVTFTDATEPAAMHELRALPGVLRVQPVRTVPAKLRFGPVERRVSVQGLSQDGALHRVVTSDGRPLPPPGVGIALSDKLARILGAGRGDSVTVAVLEGRRPVRRIPVTVVAQQYVGLAAYMDLDRLNRLMGEGANLSGADLQVDARRLEEVYDALLERPRVAGVTRRSEVLGGLRRTLDRNLMLMILFFVGFAGVIAIGVVYNSAHVALAERTRELASLRVLGFTRGEVSYILLGELAVLTLAALPLGCILGHGLAWAMVRAYDTELFRMPLVIEADTYAWSMLTVLLAAIASGWLVRRRIDHLDLIAVLKSRE